MRASLGRVFSSTSSPPFKWTSANAWDILEVDSRSRPFIWDLGETNIEVRFASDGDWGKVVLEDGSPFLGNEDVGWLLELADDSLIERTASVMWSMDLEAMARAVESGQKDGPPDPGEDSKRWLWGIVTGVYAWPGAQYFDLLEALEWAVPGIEGAVVKTWSAAGASSWSVEASWSGGTKPAAADDVVFDGTSAQTCTIDELTAALTSFSVNAGYTGTINANTGQGTTVGLHGAGTFAGAFTLNSSLAAFGRVFNFSTFTMSAGTVVIGAQRQIRPSGTVNISAGTWTSGWLVTEATAAHNFTASITMTEVMIGSTTNDVTVTMLANLTASTSFSVESLTDAKTTTCAVVATIVTVTGAGTVKVGAGDGLGNGSVTFTTGTLDTGTGAVTIGQASGDTGSLGSATAWTFNQDGAATFAATATFITPVATRGWLVGNSVTINASATVTEGSAIGMSQDAACTANIGQALTMWWVVEAAVALTLAANLSCAEFRLVTASSSVVGAGFLITTNGATSTGNTGIVNIPTGTTISGVLDLTVTGIIATRTSAVYGTGNVRNFIDSNTSFTLNLGTSLGAFTTDGTYAKTGAGASATGGTNAFTTTGAASITGGTLTLDGTLACSSTLEVGSGATLAIVARTNTVAAAVTMTGALTATTGTCTWSTTSTIAVTTGSITYSDAGAFTQTQEMTLNGTASWNAATVSIGTGRSVAALQVVIGAAGVWTGGSGTHTVGSVGQGAPGYSFTATSGTMTIDGTNTSGSTPFDFYEQAGTFTHSNGTISITVNATVYVRGTSTGITLYNLTKTNSTMAILGATTQLWTIANNLTVTSGTFSTKSGASSDQNLTVTAATSVAGTLTLNGSTCSFASGSTTVTGLGGTGTVNMGSAAVTANTVLIQSVNWTLTSGTLTLNGTDSGGVGFGTTSVGYAHGSGTVSFTYAGAQYFWNNTGTSAPLYNMTVAKGAGNVLQHANAAGVNLAVSNNLTITSGTLDTEEVTSGTDRNLSVTGTSSITGTLDCNGSTISLGSGLTSAYAVTINTGATFTGGTGTHTIGSINATPGAGTTSFTLSSGTTTIDGVGSAVNEGAFATNGNITTYSHGSGTVQFTRSGNQKISDSNNTTRTTFYNLTVNVGASAVQFTTDNGYNMTVANNLVVTAGTLTPQDGTSRTFTVTNTSSITGTLNCSNDTVSLGSGVSGTYGLTVNAGGLFTGGSGTHTIGSITTAGATGTVTFTSGTTTINGTVGGWILRNQVNGATWTHSSGSLVVTTAGASYIGSGNDVAAFNYTFALNNLEMNAATRILTISYSNPNSGTQATTIAGTLTITAGTVDMGGAAGITSSVTVTGATSITGSLTTATGTVTTTFNGAVTINNLGTLGSNVAYTLDCNANLTISAGGTCSAPNATGTFNFSGATFTPTGTYTANTGVMNFDRAGTSTLGAAFTTAYSVAIATGATLDTDSAGNYALTTASGSASTTAGTGSIVPNTSTVTMGGTLTTAGTGTVGGNTAWTLDCNGVLTIGSGTILSIPSSGGAFNLSANAVLNGTTTDNGVTWTQDGTTDTTISGSEFDSSALSMAHATITKGNSTATVGFTIGSIVRGDLTLTNGVLLFNGERERMRVLGSIILNGPATIEGRRGSLTWRNIRGGNGRLKISPVFDFRWMYAPPRVYGEPVANWPGQVQY